MKASPILGITLIAVACVLSSCGTAALGPETTDPNAEDAAAVMSAVGGDASIQDDLFDDQTDMSFGDAMTARPATLIHPLRYWRTITRAERSFEFAFSDSDSTGKPRRALVTLHRHFAGRFNILAGDSVSFDVPRDSLERWAVHKPLVDEWTRRILLERVTFHDSAGVGSHSLADWRIVAVSGVHVRSDVEGDVNPVRIVSLQVQVGDYDTTVTDPGALVRKADIARFQAGQTVTLTVTTERPDDVVVLLKREHRQRLLNNGDNTYTGSWVCPDVGGVHHLGVNAFSHETLFDDTAPYSSDAWLWHYGLRGDLVARD